MRRTVAEKHAITFERTERQIHEEPAIRRAEMLAGPEHRLQRHVVEAFPIFEAGSDAIVIATDVELAALHGAHGVEDLIRLCTVADEVSQTDDAIKLFAPDAPENGAQRFGIGVQIADDEGPHQFLRATFFAESRNPFGSSSSRRSTISEGVSSSRISKVTSDIR